MPGGSTVGGGRAWTVSPSVRGIEWSLRHTEPLRALWCNYTSRKPPLTAGWCDIKPFAMELLDCPLCRFLMCEPVTVACGHTFCRRCVGSFLLSRCPTCKERLKPRDTRSMKNNVLLISVVEKCCPDDTKVKYQILERLKAKEFTEALRVANEGITRGKSRQNCPNEPRHFQCTVLHRRCVFPCRKFH